MTEQLQIPETALVLLTDNEIASIRAKLIESQGDIVKADVSMEQMRNVIYTCRMKANPMQDNGESAPKAKKPKGEPSIMKPILSGDNVNDFLG